MIPGWWTNLTEKVQARIPFLRKLPVWSWWLIALAALGIIIALTNTTSSLSSSAVSESPLDSVFLGFSVFLKLTAVIILIYAAAYSYKHWRGALPNRAPKQLSVIETTHLSPRQALHLIRVGERVILIGATDQNLNYITDISSAAGAASDTNRSEIAQNAGQLTSGSPDFASIFRNY